MAEGYAYLADLAAYANIPEGTLRRWASEQRWRSQNMGSGRRRYRIADAVAAINARAARETQAA